MFTRLRTNLRVRYFAKHICGKGSLANYPMKAEDLRFCLEGYPRSANSSAAHFLVPLLESEFKKKHTVLHHTHDIRAVKLSLLLQIPILVLIRDPLSAISSNYIYHQGRRSPSELIKSWLEFYQFVSNHREEILLSDFTTIVNDVNKVIRSINNRYGMSLPYIDNCGPRIQQLAVAQKKLSLTRRSDEYFSVYPLPDDRREERKLKVRPFIESNALYSKALDLYGRLRADV